MSILGKARNTKRYSSRRGCKNEQSNHLTDQIEKLICEVKSLRRIIMATKQEVLDAIAAEKAEVLSEIQKLKDQIASGSPVTPADLDDIISAVKGIVVPE